LPSVGLRSDHYLEVNQFRQVFYCPQPGLVNEPIILSSVEAGFNGSAAAMARRQSLEKPGTTAAFHMLTGSKLDLQLSSLSLELRQ